MDYEVGYCENCGGRLIYIHCLDEVVKSNKAFLVSNRINCTGKATINSLISNVIELYKLNWEV